MATRHAPEVAVLLVALTVGTAILLLGVDFLLKQISVELQPELSWAPAGFLIGTPLLASIFILLASRRGDKRLGFLLLLLAILMLMVVIGPWTVALGVLLASIVVFWFSAYLQRDLYYGKSSAALEHHLQLALGKIGGDVRVSNGKLASASLAIPVKGPRRLRIDTGSAVIVKGAPGSTPKVLMQPAVIGGHESVEAVYDVRDKQLTVGLDDILTQESMVCSAQISATYGVRRKSVKDAAGKVLLLLDPDSILALGNAQPDLETATRRALERAIRQQLNLQGVCDLAAARNHEGLEQQIRVEANKKTGDWGTEIRHVAIDSIRIHPEVTNAIERASVRRKDRE